MAIDQMLRYRIPASIHFWRKAFLESSAGRSMLVTTANNHFGIKTGGTWTGPFVLRSMMRLTSSLESTILLLKAMKIIPSFWQGARDIVRSFPSISTTIEPGHEA